MKRIIYLKAVAITTLCFCLFSNTYGQLELPGDILSGGVNDAQQIFKSYVAPTANGIGASLSTGWYNTAKPHKLGGFDLTITMNMTLIPEEAKTFNLDELSLSDRVRIEGDRIVSTMSGKNVKDTRLEYYETVGQGTPAETEVNFAGYESPPGIGLNIIPLPMAQLGIGLIKETEIMGRWVPTVNFRDNGELGLWGVGLKHSVSQWIPAISKLPVVNISIMGGYTKFHALSNLDFTPDDLNAIDMTSDAVVFDDQSIELNVSSFTMNLLVSADLPIICFYGGVGFASTNTALDMYGYYPIPAVDSDPTSPTFSEVIVTDASVVEKDPLSMEIKNTDGGTTKPRLNIGMRLKFGVITLHGDFTKADYSVVSAGLGISFR